MGSGAGLAERAAAGRERGMMRSAEFATGVKIWGVAEAMLATGATGRARVLTRTLAISLIFVLTAVSNVGDGAAIEYDLFRSSGAAYAAGHPIIRPAKAADPRSLPVHPPVGFLISRYSKAVSARKNFLVQRVTSYRCGTRVFLATDP
jgi:hypothetical protein